MSRLNTIIKRSGLVIAVSIAIAACESTPNLTVTEYQANVSSDIGSKLANKLTAKIDKEQNLLSHARRYPKDTTALHELFQMRVARFEKTDKIIDLESALEIIELLFDKQPNHQDVVFQYYRLNLIQSFATGTFDYQYWQSFYQRYSFFKTIDLAPPAYLDYIIHKDEINQGNKTKKRLLEVIQSNPSFVSGYKDLATKFAEEQNYAMSLYLYDKANKLSPNSQDILALYNAVRMNYAWDHMCTANVEPQVALAFEDYKQLTRQQPKNADFHHDMSMAARILGKNSLSKFSSKKASNLDKLYLNNLLQAYLWSDNKENIENVIAEIPQEQLEASDLFVQLMAHITHKDWQAVTDDLALYVTKDKIEFYGVLYGAYAHKMLGNVDLFNLTLDSGLKNVEINDWHKRMLAYAQGSINHSELISAAKNRCDVSEGEFISSLEALAKGDEATFLEALKKVKSQNVPLFYEYAAAENMLKRYSDTQPNTTSTISGR